MIEVKVSSRECALALCPWCGDAWARIQGFDSSWWRQHYVPCLNHPGAAFAYAARVGGSLLELDPQLIDILPADLLRREFALHCIALDRGFI